MIELLIVGLVAGVLGLAVGGVLGERDADELGEVRR